MAAYLIANIRVTDPARMQEYSRQVPAVVAQYGGTYKVRAGAVTALEGRPDLHRVVVLEFADTASLRRFYESAEYAPLIELRQSASEGDLAMVEGVE